MLIRPLLSLVIGGCCVAVAFGITAADGVLRDAPLPQVMQEVAHG